MKRVAPLLADELVTLQEVQKNSQKAHFRKRCLAIELSDRDKSVTYIADLLKTRPDTIYTWIKRWDSEGLSGLMIKPGTHEDLVGYNLLNFDLPKGSELNMGKAYNFQLQEQLLDERAKIKPNVIRKSNSKEKVNTPKTS